MLALLLLFDLSWQLHFAKNILLSVADHWVGHNMFPDVGEIDASLHLEMKKEFKIEWQMF